MKKLKKWWKDITTITPKEWKKMQKVCLGIAGAAGSTWGTIAILPGVDLNGWGKVFAAVIGCMMFFGTYAQSMTNEKKEQL